MNYDQFRNLLCWQEFEIQCDLLSVSKIDVLKEIGHRINDYYLFISYDGIFNWYDLEGNHVEDPRILKEIKNEHISHNILKCVIPNSVLSISKNAFWNCISLKEIIIPNSVISIGCNAFAYCSSLKEIVIPNSVTRIGYNAFVDCIALTEISIPNSVTQINDAIFFGCKSLKKITIPNSVISIGVGAFYNCKLLKEITILDSVTNIGRYAFYCCTSLKEVVFKGKTLEEVKQMENYPFRIEDESIIKCELR